jgi:acetyl-CoA carboxylase biotin carboxyl carrier protein
MATKQVLSPLPGTFYRRPAPDKPVYKEVGDSVTAGDVIGLVEVMKTFYEVKAEGGGKVSKFHVENEDAIQAGDPIADLEG